MIKNLTPLFILAISLSCSPKTSDENSSEDTTEEQEFVEYNNPPAEGFNQEGSDLLATLLADKVMNAMGGRAAWDNTRYLSWNFFGSRTHIWDKLTGDVRIEDPGNETTILLNINSMEGRVKMGEEELTNADSLAKYLEKGKNMWINDSYWLVMPFKLKDTGVTLYYIGEDTTELGQKSDVIQLTFENVGVTPDNLYYVWVDVDSKLVTQWAYYPSADSEEPRFTLPWGDYQQYGEILLSGSRGKYELTDIQIFEEVPEGTFSSFEPLVL